MSEVIQHCCGFPALSGVCPCHTGPKKHIRSHSETNRFNVTLQFPVMQNTAAIVFQGEAGGTTPRPISSLGDTSTEAAPPPVTLHCPWHYSSVCKTSILVTSLSAQCFAAVCSSALSLAFIYQEICPITHECNFPSNRNTSSTGTVVC